MVKVALDHIEVSVHQDSCVVPDGQKREIPGHLEFFFYFAGGWKTMQDRK
jgi:hypothetical protein